MDKNTVIKIRKELHNLPGKERGMALPISISKGLAGVMIIMS